MMFVDYTFTLVDGKDILFDSEVTPENLNVREGDRFEVVLVGSTVILKRVAS